MSCLKRYWQLNQGNTDKSIEEITTADQNSAVKETIE